MVKSWAVLLVGLFVGAGIVRAGTDVNVTNVFLTTFKGQIQTPTTKTTVTEANFVAPGHSLYMVVDELTGLIFLMEGTGTATNLSLTSPVMESDHTAFMNNDTFATTWTVPNGDPSIAYAGPGALVFGGELLVGGKGTMKNGATKRFKASVGGIWNDPQAGNTNAPAAIFKGTLSGKSLIP